VEQARAPGPAAAQSAGCSERSDQALGRVACQVGASGSRGTAPFRSSQVAVVVAVGDEPWAAGPGSERRSRALGVAVGVAGGRENRRGTRFPGEHRGFVGEAVLRAWGQGQRFRAWVLRSRA
jgi:hypothetical protein